MSVFRVFDLKCVVYRDHIAIIQPNLRYDDATVENFFTEPIMSSNDAVWPETLPWHLPDSCFEPQQQQDR